MITPSRLSAGLLVAAPALLLSVPLMLAAPAPRAAAAPSPDGARLYLPILGPVARAIDPPAFSRTRGYVEAPFRLALAAPSGTAIRYTLDGSPPTPTRGLVYSAAIPIAETRLVRAIAYRPGSRLPASAVATHSYLFADQILRQPDAPAGFPASWGIPPLLSALGPIAADYGMDPEVTGDPRYAAGLRADLASLPAVSIVTAVEDLFGDRRGIYTNATARGEAWERPASVELIHPDGRAGFQVDAGLRIAGVASRHHQYTIKHSFSLHFRERYGAARLEQPLFGGSAVERFDTLRLRAGFNDSGAYQPWRAQYLRDAWGRASQRAMGWSTPRGRFVQLFLDGLYWGVYELTEEPTAAWAADHEGGREADYDVVKSDARGESGVEDGNRAAYTRLAALDGLVDPVRYRQAEALVDIPQQADYMLLNFYGANRDWPLTNWRAFRNRVTGAPFRFVIWDFETSLDLLAPGHVNYDAAHARDISDGPGVDRLHARLMQNAEYRMVFADRARRQLLDGGPLSAAAASARYLGLATQVERAMVLESARWGDMAIGGLARRDGGALWAAYEAANGRGHPWTRDEEWRAEQQRLQTDFFARRDLELLWQLCDRVLYPPIVAPDLAPPSGADGPALRLVLRPGEGGCPGARRDGQIYFSTDGSDPRLPGSGDPVLPWTGQISHRARRYTGPVRLDGYARVMARMAVEDRGRLLWSALSEASYGRPDLAFGELMYHPPAGDSEFLEIVNRERIGVDLSGYQTRGITYTFPAGSQLPAGGRQVLVQDPEAFARQHPAVAVAGVYTGRLSDAGERLALVDPAGETRIALRYDDAGFWPLAPDGRGHSLVPAEPEAATHEPSDPRAWRASSQPGGSPGRPDPPSPWPSVWIDEVLAHAPEPYEDAVELYNPGPDLADISGWFLGDDPADPRAFRIPDGTLLLPGRYAVFYGRDLRLGLPGPVRLRAAPPAPDAAPARPASLAPTRLGQGLALPATGGRLYLASADRTGRLTGLLQGFDYPAAEAGLSFGRLEMRQAPEVARLDRPSFGVAAPESLEAFRSGSGAPNAAPKVGPVILSEIMYHPAAGGLEYVELQSVASTPSLLHAPSQPESAWRFNQGIDFVFPEGALLAAGGRALVVPIDPERFRGQHGLPAELPIFGPYAGRLANEGEALALARPFVRQETEGGSVVEDAEVYVTVDRVRYDDASPWPVLADGAGASLERRDPERYGDDPDAWLALTAGGTPGRANTVPRSIWLPLVSNRR
ncbi:MAG: lamin tail domain-containing protein [Caldilineae bacterium]|nr:lamin tail domain-containing protein [Chloroflexota bacterium]MCB9177265.1 lamin tail domain-containing protein [Caldilineae bacterium]